MYSAKAASFNDLYHRLCHDVETMGTNYGPRGKVCRELRPAHFTIRRPELGLYTGLSRSLSYRFFAIETLSYIAGWGNRRQHAELLVASNPNIAFCRNDETELFDGAYGPRLNCSLEAVVKMLRKDPDCRQCYASIWSPGIPQDSKDVPCTLGLHFYKDGVIEGEDEIPCLSMTAMMRSNDLNWGTPYDVGAFCAIQLAVADCLGWMPGDYHHIAGSLHLYLKTEGQVERPPKILPIDEETFITRHKMTRLSPLPRHSYKNMASLQGFASRFLQEVYKQVIEEKKPWESVQTHYEFGNRDAEYWRQWGDMVRWKWA